MEIFNTFIQAMASVMQWLYELCAMIGLAEYGLAIILFTIIIRIALFPLGWKQTVSMRKMTEIQPEMQRIQKKYANNKERMNQKVMDLYARENVSPYAGCLPMIIQLPILLCFYQMLRSFSYGDEASAIFFGFNLTQSYGFALSYHLILPIIAGITTYLSMKISTIMNNRSKELAAKEQEAAGKKKKKQVEAPPNPMEKQQGVMGAVMAVFMAYIVATLPSGLGIYILTSNLLGVGQTVVINVVLDKKKKREREQEAVDAV